jgi:hypothetical protein
MFWILSWKVILEEGLILLDQGEYKDSSFFSTKQMLSMLNDRWQFAEENTGKKININITLKTTTSGSHYPSLVQSDPEMLVYKSWIQKNNY